MIRISSGLTLMLRIFLPVFYTVFMLTWTIATIRAGDEVSPLFASKIYQVAMIIFLFIGLFIIRLTLWRLKRMDIAKDFIYITDYFKTFRYSFNSIASIEPFSIAWLKFLRITLKEKGSLGKVFIVLIEKKMWDSYCSAHPEMLQIVRSS
jgi:hypothetical protein